MAADRIGVIGAGAFGTALAIAHARAGHRVTLWARNPEQAATMNSARCNASRLPGVALPDGVAVTADFDRAVQDAAVLLLSVPTQALRGLVQEHAALLQDRVLVACSKGVERGSGLLPTQVIESVLPDARTAVLTGPSFAADVADGKPTALTLASQMPDAAALQERLATPSLRLYLSDDVPGAQLGGALKNVIAIAAGITIGAGLGESARAALMTRGFAEIVRLAEARGADPATLWGLSGFGDMVLTCTSEKSRNYRHGVALGSGQAPDEGQTVEGVMTAHAIVEATERAADILPVSAMVSAFLRNAVSLNEAVSLLLSRPLRHERE
ncbi:MAG: NAD(P)-dependent glycerol-3-phosphate dehydrogenase [Pararhodobacter sp.]|nr:NAD(P)-dependent glycerol-3-phosphate dehydrogenase [Pararhodobacter sp.]